MNANDVAPEQVRYAEWLRWTSGIGLAVLAAAFVLYVAGVLPPLIPFEQLPQAWKLSSREMIQHYALKGGWSWIHSLGSGDMLNLLGIAILSGCSAFPLLAVTGIYLKRRDWTFALLCLLQVAVLALAASGLIGTGQ